MGKNNKNKVQESDLILPLHSSQSNTPIVDTHTHLVSTFSAYKSKFKEGKHATIHEFVRGVYGVGGGEIVAGNSVADGSDGVQTGGSKVEAIIDVWCEAPVQKKIWREIADSASTEEGRRKDWGGIEYWFVMGALTYILLLFLVPSTCSKLLWVYPKPVYYMRGLGRMWCGAFSNVIKIVV